jgi:choline dehydrogenase-like flavoprotein
VRGLRVVDAGAMPQITSGNTNSPTLMMAERAAEWIVAEARSSGRPGDQPAPAREGAAHFSARSSAAGVFR